MYPIFARLSPGGRGNPNSTKCRDDPDELGRPSIRAGQRPGVPPAEAWGGLMSGIEATEAIGILAIFLGGIVLGVVLIVSAAIRREDRRFSLSGAAPDS